MSEIKEEPINNDQFLTDLNNPVKLKPKEVFNIIINDQYLVNLIFDRYIHYGTYKSVYDYIQLDDQSNDFCRINIYHQGRINDDEKLIDSLVGKNNGYNYSKVITINLIKKVLLMNPELINDKNRLNRNKWMITQRLINNDYNKNPLFNTGTKNNYLSSVLICGKCHQLMVGNNNTIINGKLLSYYRCTNRVIPNKKTDSKDKDRIGCDCKNLVINYINLVIFEILINLDSELFKNKFIVKLFNRYKSVFLSNDYNDINNKLKRSFILIFINFIEWKDVNKEFIIHLYDYHDNVTFQLINNKDSYGLLNNGYFINNTFVKIDKYRFIK